MNDTSTRYPDALHYAATLHATDVRKGTQIPYISHLVAVSGLVLEYGGSTETAIAALLHDALEDAADPVEAELRASEIEARFGRRVLEIVEACTDGLPDKTGVKPPWEERKRKYLAHLFSVSPDALLVSCCDKLHNARAVLRDYREHGEALWQRFNGGREGTLGYYRSLVTTFDMIQRFSGSPPSALVSELDQVVTQIEKQFGPVRLKELGGLPKPVVKQEKATDQKEIGWAEGLIGGYRPYRAECWAQDGITMLTTWFSSIGLEDFTVDEIRALLEEEDLVRLVDDSPAMSAHKRFDAADNPVWSVNVVIGDGDRVFARDNIRLNPYPA